MIAMPPVGKAADTPGPGPVNESCLELLRGDAAVRGHYMVFGLDADAEGRTRTAGPLLVTAQGDGTAEAARLLLQLMRTCIADAQTAATPDQRPTGSPWTYIDGRLHPPEDVLRRRVTARSDATGSQPTRAVPLSIEAGSPSPRPTGAPATRSTATADRTRPDKPDRRATETAADNSPGGRTIDDAKAGKDGPNKQLESSSRSSRESGLATFHAALAMLKSGKVSSETTRRAPERGSDAHARTGTSAGRGTSDTGSAASREWQDPAPTSLPPATRPVEVSDRPAPKPIDRPAERIARLGPAEATREQIGAGNRGPASTESEFRLSRAGWRDVQKRLTLLGYRPGPADGKPGRKTRAALINWQRNSGLAGTGRLARYDYDRLLEESDEVGRQIRRRATRVSRDNPDTPGVPPGTAATPPAIPQTETTVVVAPPSAPSPQPASSFVLKPDNCRRDANGRMLSNQGPVCDVLGLVEPLFR